MQTQSAKPVVIIPVTAELIKALDVVVDLAEGSSLDPTDPDMEDDPDLLELANQQLGAVDLVSQFLSMAAPGHLYLDVDHHSQSGSGLALKYSSSYLDVSS